MGSVVFLNGIYDIACAICIFSYPEAPLATLHSNMFYGGDGTLQPQCQRLCAHVCALNGIIRLHSIYSTNTRRIIAASYWIEAFVWCMELFRYETVHPYPASMTIALGLFLGVLCF